VVVRSILGVELLGADLTFNGGCPVVQGVHVLIGGRLRRELAGARLAFESWCPVAQGIHMLTARIPGAEGSVAGLAFDPMIVVIHVLVAVLLVGEPRITLETFRHFGQTCENVRWEGDYLERKKEKKKKKEKENEKSWMSNRLSNESSNESPNGSREEQGSP
jgi:hypothetical protein